MFTSRRSLTALTVLVVVLTGAIVGCPAAPAYVPADPGPVISPPPTPPAASGGAPMWVFVLVAVLTVALTIAAMLIAGQLRRSHHPRLAHL
jgi:hypothetical protein